MRLHGKINEFMSVFYGIGIEPYLPCLVHGNQAAQLASGAAVYGGCYQGTSLLLRYEQGYIFIIAKTFCKTQNKSLSSPRAVRHNSCKTNAKAERVDALCSFCAGKLPLEVGRVRRSGEGNNIPYIGHAGNIEQQPLKAEPEA